MSIGFQRLVITIFFLVFFLYIVFVDFLYLVCLIFEKKIIDNGIIGKMVVLCICSIGKYFYLVFLVQNE